MEKKTLIKIIKRLNKLYHVEVVKEDPLLRLADFMVLLGFKLIFTRNPDGTIRSINFWEL